ncbi:hypothetical protein [Polaribacter sp. M15]
MKLKIQILLVVFFGLTTLKIEAQQPPNFNALKRAGIEKYDSEKINKKLKVTEEKLKGQITRHIQIYNQEMDNLLLLHSDTLKDLENEFDRNVRIAMQNRDPSQMDGVKAKIEKIIPPIRLDVQKFKKHLNIELNKILNEKQYKKWLKY